MRGSRPGQAIARSTLAPLVLAALGCQAEARSAPAAAAIGAVASTDMEQCRQDLLGTMALYREVLRTDAARQQVDRTTGLLVSLTPGDLEVLRHACAGVGEWKRAVSAARDLAAARTGAAAASPVVTAAPFPDAPYSTLCGSGRSNTEVIFGFQVALQVARGVWSAASRACDQVVVVCPVPGGGNTSLACIVADEALFVAEKVLEDVKFCDEDIDSAEIRGSYDRIAYVHDQVADLDRKIGEIDQKIDALARAVESLRVLGCDTVRLEHTPQGLRASSVPACSDQPGFPYSWPQR